MLFLLFLWGRYCVLCCPSFSLRTKAFISISGNGSSQQPSPGVFGMYPWLKRALFIMLTLTFYWEDIPHPRLVHVEMSFIPIKAT